jgi:hypothetical protein
MNGAVGALLPDGTEETRPTAAGEGARPFASRIAADEGGALLEIEGGALLGIEGGANRRAKCAAVPAAEAGANGSLVPALGVGGAMLAAAEERAGPLAERIASGVGVMVPAAACNSLRGLGGGGPSSLPGRGLRLRAAAASMRSARRAAAAARARLKSWLWGPGGAEGGARGMAEDGAMGGAEGGALAASVGLGGAEGGAI